MVTMAWREMTAQYKGTCARCGAAIRVGDTIEWDRDTRQSRHKHCDPEVMAATITVCRGSGYGDPYTPGQVIHRDKKSMKKGEPEFVTVVGASAQFIREDGLSFGVGEDTGYIYTGRCRPATPEEIAPVVAAEAAAKARAAARKRIREIVEDIRKRGERPDPGEGKYIPRDEMAGEELLDTRNAYGGGDRWIIGETWAWYAQGNGGDGDCFAHNNAPSEIVWRLPVTDPVILELLGLAPLVAADIQDEERARRLLAHLVDPLPDR
jgi:hypothetical protein